MNNDNQYIYIQTIGCQMNVYDSQQIVRLLKPMGYVETPSMKQADLIILNTCSIREKAQQKVFSFLGRLNAFKKRNPKLIIAVGGCVAQQEGANVQDRAPFVDIVFGTHTIHKLPDMILQIRNSQKEKITDLEFSDQIHELIFKEDQLPESSITGFVTIMRGCDNYCSFCVVPYVRGREMSRKPEIIIDEIKEKIGTGMKEVTLLGQNVNSYGQKEGLCSFTELLRMIDKLDGLARIRFTTSHPKDLSPELIKAFGELSKLCKHIHLPVQSGSDRILKKMNRKYNRSQYLEKIDALRQVCPDIAISSDIIVGFPSETDEEYEETLSLIDQVQYDTLFAFQYSDRDIAKASRYTPKVPDEVKAQRLNNLFKIQSEITLKKYKAKIGTIQAVLVEGYSKQGQNQWTGRTSGNVIVNFPSPASQQNVVSSGTTVMVEIKETFSHSLFGTAC